MAKALIKYALTALLLCTGLAGAQAQESGSSAARKAVPKIQDGWLDVRAGEGQGRLPIHVSRDWSQAQPAVRRALIVVHGITRDDLLAGERAAAKVPSAADDAIIITPQFLIAEDVAAHQLPELTLRWGVDDWKAGFKAQAPAPLSAYAVMDAIFARLLDRQLFPNLQSIVLAGHSAGGQYLQRYALFGQGSALVDQAGVRLRYVVANPSSYAYANDLRPLAAGGFAAADASQCERVDRWPYSLSANLPAYARKPLDPAALMRRYLAHDVIYLLGEEDKDPHHPQLDKSCAGEAQGDSRLQRGRYYFAYAAQFPRDAAFKQRLFIVPGVAHNSTRMFGSSCGLAALFDEGRCTTEVAAP
ncbi:hypothetical protein [Uliginosibacterium sediminicola]|uniref:Alpha/beta hydrolase family protein n=1 Tax=Uliginosibacterium sediminicola TaxID=2024550 RepID=A0ABU9YVD1_9RHOO